MCGSCGGSKANASSQEPKGCGACQLCCPCMRPVCDPISCCAPCCPSSCCSPCCPPSCCAPCCPPCPTGSGSSSQRKMTSSCCPCFPCCNPCMPCCPPLGYSCKTKGPCPTACCGAKCNQVVTCCPKPTIQPIQIWGCTPHGCCNTGASDTIEKRGGGGFCS